MLNNLKNAYNQVASVVPEILPTISNEGNEAANSATPEGPVTTVVEGQGTFINVPLGTVPPDYYDPADKARREKNKLAIVPSELLTPDFAMFRLQKMLIKRHVYGFPGTKGDKMECLKQHVLNEHSIFGISKAHPDHPFSRKERLAFLLTMWLWTFFMTTMLTSMNWKTIEVLGTKVCVEKPEPVVGQTTVIIITMILIVPLGKFVRFLLDCSTFYNGEYSGNVKAKLGFLFSFLEICGKMEVCFVFGIGLILLIIAILVVNSCNSKGGSMQSGTAFIIAQLFSAFGSELAQMVALFYWNFDAAKEEFECVHACQFPEGSPPTDMTQVALRAKENFMWDPLVYGRSADGAQDKKLNRANALASFNAKFGAFYESSFGVGNEEGVTATPPPGLVDGAKDNKAIIINI